MNNKKKYNREKLPGTLRFALFCAMYIPSISTPNVSIPEFNRVMINNYQVGTTDKPVLAWLGDPFIEYTKMK